MQNKSIGFIGTGVMGKSMVKNLQQAGYTVHVFTRTETKAVSLVEDGAIWEKSVANLARVTDIIITMVGDPRDVEDVYFGPHGILENAREGTYVIDMTTSKPSLAKEIFNEATRNHLYALDAPVSGGDIGAKNGTLSIMVGGEQHVFDTLLPLFNTLGENIILQGPAGAGQHTKMSNQINDRFEYDWRL